MKLIELSKKHDPYIVKANYTADTKATFFDYKTELLNDKQTQFLSYCVANNYQTIYDFKKDPFVKSFLDTITVEQEEKLNQQLDIYNYGSILMLPKSLDVNRGNTTYEVQTSKEDIKRLLFDDCTNIYQFDELDDFQEYLDENLYDHLKITGLINYTINNETKTYEFTNEGYIFLNDIYNAIKTVLQNENITLIKDIDPNEENNTCTFILEDNKTLTLNFSYELY